jgi:hypothetical protein
MFKPPKRNSQNNRPYGSIWLLSLKMPNITFYGTKKKHWDSAIQKTGPGVGFVAQSRPYLAGSYHGET